MDRGELLDRQDRVWRLIDNVRHALRANLSRPTAWKPGSGNQRDGR
jgi:hypothetical protein